MTKRYVKETSGNLFLAATRDVISIISLLTITEDPIEIVYEHICYTSKAAVEKYLKGFIRDNNCEIVKVRDLIYLWKKAMKINNDFLNIKEICEELEKYNKKMMYGSKQRLTDEEVEVTLKSVVEVFNFPPIKVIRERFEKENKIYKIPDIKKDMVLVR